MGNVPDHITDAELAEYFCEVGEVLTVQIRGNGGAHYAFVEFAYPEHVEEVLNLASQQPFMLDDSALRVQPRHYGREHQVSLVLCLLMHWESTVHAFGDQLSMHWGSFVHALGIST